MSDYDDYENNLFFEPIGDMSKLNDCNDGKRGSDVLLSTVDKCKDLEEKLANSEKMRDLQAEYACKLEKKLKLATNTIEQVLKEPNLMDAGILMYLTVQLNKIKEKKDDIQK